MMASPGEQDVHTRHVGTAWRHQSDGISRRGSGDATGTVAVSRDVDLRHQTLAKPETRRGSAETGRCAAAAWRSGARRLDRAAGQEPKGAMCPACSVKSIDEQLQRVAVNQATTSRFVF